MGCACKNVKKVESLASNANHYNREKKGVKRYLSMMWDLLGALLRRLVIIILIFILVPVVIGILLYNFIFKGEIFLGIPSFLWGKSQEDNVNLEEV